MSGFPIVSEAREGTIFWRFIEGFSAESPVSLTLTELMALYYSRGLLRPLQGTEIYDSIEIRDAENWGDSACGEPAAHAGTGRSGGSQHRLAGRTTAAPARSWTN